MANTTNKKFGVVRGAPSQLSSATIEEGKLYFLAGEADGAIKQGIYGVDGITADASGNVTDYNLAMFGCGSVADGNGYGLSQANFTTNEKNKLAEFGAASTYLTTAAASANYLKIKDASYFATVKVGNTSIVADSSKDTLEFVAGSNVTITPDATNDKITISATDTVYTGTSPINVNGTTISHANSGVTAGRYGDTSSGRTLNFGDKFKVVDVSVNEFGHITKASSYELTLPAKPSTAGNADVANQTAGTLTIKGNGTSVETFNGSDAEVNIKSGNESTLTVTGTADGSITITPVTAAVASNSSALTTGAQVATYVSTQLGNLAGALLYQGTVSNATELNSKAKTQGHVWISSSKDWEYTDVNNQKYKIEVGDMFICNGTGWNIVSSEFDVSTYSNTLSWGTDVSIAVVDGVTIKAKLPANPNTDYQATKAGHYTPEDKDASVDATANGSIAWSGAVVTGITKDNKGHITGVTTSTIPSNPNTDENVKDSSGTAKSFILGHASQGSTAAATTNVSVYMQAGKMYATSGSVASNDTALVTGGTVYTAIENAKTAATTAATIYWETL